MKKRERKSNAGRKPLLSRPVAATYYLEPRHKKALERIAEKLHVRGPSAALRHLLDNYDFSADG